MDTDQMFKIPTRSKTRYKHRKEVEQLRPIILLRTKSTIIWIKVCFKWDHRRWNEGSVDIFQQRMNLKFLWRKICQLYRRSKHFRFLTLKVNLSQSFDDLHLHFKAQLDHQYLNLSKSRLQNKQIPQLKTKDLQTPDKLLFNNQFFKRIDKRISSQSKCKLSKIKSTISKVCFLPQQFKAVEEICLNMERRLCSQGTVRSRA